MAKTPASATPPPTAAADSTAPKKEKVVDLEIEAITRISKALAALPPEAAQRVLDYAIARWAAESRAKVTHGTCESKVTTEPEGPGEKEDF